jgi:hypothetical protein
LAVKRIVRITSPLICKCWDYQLSANWERSVTSGDDL